MNFSKKYKKLSALNTLPSVQVNQSDQDIAMGLHSRTATASVGLDNLYRIIRASAHTLKELKDKNNVLKMYLSKCYEEKPELFLETINTYVYEFSNDPWKSGKYDSQQNPIIKFWEGLKNNFVVQLENEDIIKYRFPFISTSKTPKHPVDFALGNRVETQSKGEFPIYPKYNSYGHPQHRLAGLIVYYYTFG